MREDFTVIYQARTLPEAHELKDRLAEVGIEAVVVDEVSPGRTGTDAIGLPEPFSVAVHEDDAPKARQVTLAFDDELIARAEKEAAQRADPEEQSETMELRDAEDAWPRCPGCDARRITVCPICKTAGSHFPLADPEYSSDAESEGRVMLLCPTCDEPFVPQYLRRCEWCGHEFADGIDSDHDHVHEPLNPWAMGLILGIAALLVGLLLYFMVIL